MFGARLLDEPTEVADDVEPALELRWDAAPIEPEPAPEPEDDLAPEPEPEDDQDDPAPEPEPEPEDEVADAPEQDDDDEAEPEDQVEPAPDDEPEVEPEPEPAPPVRPLRRREPLRARPRVEAAEGNGPVFRSDLAPAASDVHDVPRSAVGQSPDVPLSMPLDPIEPPPRRRRLRPMRGR